MVTALALKALRPPIDGHPNASERDQLEVTRVLYYKVIMKLIDTTLRSASAAMLVLFAGLAALVSYGIYRDLDPGRAYMHSNATRFQGYRQFCHGIQ